MARGTVSGQKSFLAFADLEPRIRLDHPLRPIKGVVDRVLVTLSPEFDAMYASRGRPSVPPERLLKALLLIALYSERSETAFCDALEYNLLYRWFLDMDGVEPAFDPSTFSKNRERLLEHAVARRFFEAIRAYADAQGWISNEHFSVDGTLIEAWASLKSLSPIDGGEDRRDDGDRGNPSVDFHGERRTNATHRSRTDPAARLYRKGNNQPTKLCYLGHSLMENRNGLLVDLALSQADGTAEPAWALTLIDRIRTAGFDPRTLGADKGYDCVAFIAALQERGIVPHVVPKTYTERTPRTRPDGTVFYRTVESTVPAAVVRSPEFAVSQRCRKRIEEGFGWIKTVANFRKTRYVGPARTGFALEIAASAYNLVRMATLERVAVRRGGAAMA